MDAEAIHRLRINVGLLWLVVLVAGLWFGFTRLQNFAKFSLTLTRDGNSYRLHGDDGPYVVFGLAAYAQNDKRWATLPAPIAIVDSGGGEIDGTALKWRDVRGEPVSAPTEGNVIPLYVRPEVNGSPYSKSP